VFSSNHDVTSISTLSLSPSPISFSLPLLLLLSPHFNTKSCARATRASIHKISVAQLHLPLRDVLLAARLRSVTDQSAKILSFMEYTQKRSLASAYRWAMRLCAIGISCGESEALEQWRTLQLVCAHLITIGINGRADERTSTNVSPVPRGGQSEGLFPRRLRVRNCWGVRVYGGARETSYGSDR